VRDYATTCETIMRGDLTQRLRVHGARDEFDALAVAVNAMLDRIEEQTTTLRAAFDSIAHDLRTPLYRLRVRLEEAQLREVRNETQVGENQHSETQQLIGPALEDLDRVQRTLATLLAIARAEAQGLTTHADKVDLAELVTGLVELYAPGMRSAGLDVSVDAPEPAPLTGNRQLLAQMITNLLENALKYVPSGGKVHLRVGNSPAGVSFRMADNGPGIAAAEREAALRPFVRVGDAAGKAAGSGLGLSLAAAVARLHGAQLALGDNAPGLVVSCEFPADARRGAPSDAAQVKGSARWMGRWRAAPGAAGETSVRSLALLALLDEILLRVTRELLLLRLLFAVRGRMMPGRGGRRCGAGRRCGGGRGGGEGGAGAQQGGHGEAGDQFHGGFRKWRCRSQRGTLSSPAPHPPMARGLRTCHFAASRAPAGSWR
jgi:signal transduction histidine kinase